MTTKGLHVSPFFLSHFVTLFFACANVKFERDIVSTCKVHTSIENYDNGEQVHGVNFVLALTKAVNPKAIL